MDIKAAIEAIENNSLFLEDKTLEKALSMAIDALEKQELKKPNHTYQSDGKIYGECPNCNHTGIMKYTHECCWWCGQKIDWDESINEDLAKD